MPSKEGLHSFHLNFGEWAIIAFYFLRPVLPNADLLRSCNRVLVPSLQTKYVACSSMIRSTLGSVLTFSNINVAGSRFARGRGIELSAP
jgi:hypothetical protein